MRKYVAFDIEIANDITSGEDWEKTYERGEPLGIACAGFAWRNPENENEILYRDFQAKDIAMSQEELIEMAAFMNNVANKGYFLTGWNSQGFDMPVIYREIREVAWKNIILKISLDHHVDPMFHFLQKKGFPIGLQKACEGQGIKGKLKKVILNDGTEFEGMTGALAPQMWREGEREAVLVYLSQDVTATLELVEKTEKEKVLCWTANSGRMNTLDLRDGWATVAEVDKWPDPDTSWMSSPPFLTKERFMDWVKQAV